MKTSMELQKILESTNDNLKYAKKDLQKMLEDNNLDDFLYTAEKIVVLNQECKVLELAMQVKDKKFMNNARERRINSLLEDNLDRQEKLEDITLVRMIKNII